jgi:DNA mismatch repair protein MutH
MNTKYNLNNKSSVLQYAKLLTGKTLRELLSKDSIKTIEHLEFLAKQKAKINSKKVNKGRFGHKLEKYYFEYEINSDANSDFPCGLELKVTPLKQINNGQLRPKERLVCNIINYIDIVNEEWATSSFLKKNKEILLIRYVDPVDADVSQLDYQIVDVRIHNLLEIKELSQFEKDWNLIVSKIRDGKAHLLSESDTKYLGACTKGANASSFRSQPNSKVLAMQRAFSFKQQYMKLLLDKSPEIYEIWSR